MVEDDAETREFVVRALRETGLEVQGVGRAEAALALLREKGADLVVLDVMMPIMDGFTVSARLRGSERTKGIPLIILTAKGEMRDLFQVSENVTSYLEKPFDPKTLRERVAAVLAKKP